MLQTTIQLKGLVRYTVEACCFVVSVCPSVCLSICLSNTFLGYTFRYEFWWKGRNCKPPYMWSIVARRSQGRVPIHVKEETKFLSSNMVSWLIPHVSIRTFRSRCFGIGCKGEERGGPKRVNYLKNSFLENIQSKILKKLMVFHAHCDIYSNKINNK